MRASTCKICNGSFYLDSGGVEYNYVCPQCKRDQKKQEYEGQQRSQQEREHKREESNRENQRRQQERENEREESNREYQRIEQKREQEKSTIKDKIYNIASDKQADTEHITKLIKLLLHQHSDYIGFIYEQIIILGSPYDNCIKQILCIEVNNAIENSNIDINISFEQKSLNYFLDRRLDFRYEIFVEFLLNKKEFSTAVNNELKNKTDELKIKTNELEIYTAKLNEDKIKTNTTRTKGAEEEQMTKVINNLGKEIEVDKETYKANKKRITLLKFIFGKYCEDEGGYIFNFLPRILWIVILMLIGFHYLHLEWFDDKKLIIVGLCYILTWTFWAINKSNQKKNDKLESLIKQKEEKLKDTKSDLSREILNEQYYMKQNAEREQQKIQEEQNELKRKVQEKESIIEKLKEILPN